MLKNYAIGFQSLPMKSLCFGFIKLLRKLYIDEKVEKDTKSYKVRRGIINLLLEDKLTIDICMK